jgi:hypothetical protein
MLLAAGTVWLALRTREVATKTGDVAQQTGEVATKTGELAEKTSALVATTADLVEKTAGLVEASLREAKATEDLALEAKADRQLAYRPQLELTFYHHSGDDFIFKVRNAGPGPAFQVTCVAQEVENRGRWTLSRLNNLRPGDESTDQTVVWTKGGALYSPFEHVPGTSTVEIVTVVILCSDVIERRFRFGQARAVAVEPTEEGLRALPADISDGPVHTGWADEPLIWG